MRNFYLILASVVTMLIAGCGKDDLPTVELTGAAADRAALIKIHEACGGWDNDTNWGTDEPLDDWSGVMTNSEGRVVRVYFYAEGGPSGELNTGGLTELAELIINDIEITSLDVTQNSKLHYLEIQNNPIASLDLSQNPELKTLRLNDVELTSLDVSNNPKLIDLSINNSPTLTEITASTNFIFDPDDISGCGEQDASKYPAPHHYDGYQYPVYTFKDLDQDAMDASVAADKAALLALLSDGVFQKGSELDFSTWSESKPLSEWNYITADIFGRAIKIEMERAGGALNLSGESGALSALRELNISNGTLESLALSNLPALESLDCGGNDITSLALSELPTLGTLLCSSNDLKSLALSDLPELWYIYCSDNLLSELSLSDLPKLERLDCYSNKFTTLPLSGLTQLKSLNCGHNQFTELTITDLPLLEHLNCNHNLLTELTLTNTPELREIHCNYNNLTELTLTDLPLLERAYCGYNKFTNITLGNLPKVYEIYFNDSPDLTSLDVSQMPNLRSICCTNTAIETLDLSKNTKIAMLKCGKTSDSGLENTIKEVLLPSTKSFADFVNFEIYGWGTQDVATYPEPNYHNGYQYPEFKYIAD